MALSFKAKQMKLPDSDSSESDDDEAFQRVHSAQYAENECSEVKDSDSDEDNW